MAVTGKTGADATYKALKRILIVMSHYLPKFKATVEIMVAGGHLTAAEAVIINEFLDSLAGLIAAVSKVADYSGF